MSLITIFNKLITAVCSQLGGSFKLNVSDGLILNFAIFRDFRKKKSLHRLKKKEEIFVNSRMLASHCTIVEHFSERHEHLRLTRRPSGWQVNWWRPCARWRAAFVLHCTTARTSGAGFRCTATDIDKAAWKWRELKITCIWSGRVKALFNAHWNAQKKIPCGHYHTTRTLAVQTGLKTLLSPLILQTDKELQQSARISTIRKQGIHVTFAVDRR